MSRNLVWGLVVLIALIGGVVYSYMQSSEPEEVATLVSFGPSILAEPTTYDFGRVKFGDISKHTFIIKNSGNQILEINGISTSCACTKGEMAVQTIAPGEQADLVVSFDPAVHGDDTDLGQLTRTVYISSNDPSQEEIEVKIYADVYKLE